MRAVTGAAVGLAASNAFLLAGYRGAPARELLFYGRNALVHRRPSEGGTVALGDSITAGTSRPAWGLLGRASWFAHAVKAGVPYGYLAAVPGQTTDMVGTAQVVEARNRRPSTAVVVTGTNDVMQHLDPAAAMARVRLIVTKLQAFCPRVIIGTLPPLERWASDIVVFNDALRATATSSGCQLIDFHAATADAHGQPRPGMLSDGIHPTPAGAAAMADAALPVLLADQDTGRIVGSKNQTSPSAGS